MLTEAHRSVEKKTISCITLRETLSSFPLDAFRSGVDDGWGKAALLWVWSPKHCKISGIWKVSLQATLNPYHWTPTAMKHFWQTTAQTMRHESKGGSKSQLLYCICPCKHKSTRAIRARAEQPCWDVVSGD